MSFPWVLQEFQMSLTWVSQEFRMSFPKVSHEFPLRFPWVSREFLMSFIWVSQEFPMSFTWEITWKTEQVRHHYTSTSTASVFYFLVSEIISTRRYEEDVVKNPTQLYCGSEENPLVVVPTFSTVSPGGFSMITSTATFSAWVTNL